ncbi:MAG: PaaI family thioesterase [Phycisphaerae bacterium]|nr:PaaI family thioesterase [Phycisphaerae bacterium]
MRAAHHAGCVVCGRLRDGGLGLRVRLRDDGSVAGTVRPSDDLAGYAGLLHGGVISALVDCAMTNCLFAHGVAAVTAELNVRFRHPVASDTLLTVAASVTRRSAPLYVARAELSQGGQVKATACGKFMEMSR